MSVLTPQVPFRDDERCCSRVTCAFPSGVAAAANAAIATAADRLARFPARALRTCTGESAAVVRVRQAFQCLEEGDVGLMTLADAVVEEAVEEAEVLASESRGAAAE